MTYFCHLSFTAMSGCSNGPQSHSTQARWQKRGSVRVQHPFSGRTRHRSLS